MVLVAAIGIVAFGIIQSSHAQFTIEHVELPHNYDSLMVKICHGPDGNENCRRLSMYDYFNDKVDKLTSELVEWQNKYSKLENQKKNDLAEQSFDRNIWINDGRVNWTFYYINHQSQRIEDVFLTTTISMPISNYEDTLKDYVGEYRKKIMTSDGDVLNSYRFDPFVKGIFSGKLPMFDAELRGPTANSGKSKDEIIIMNAVFMSSQLVSYDKDIGQKARYADETLTRGGGDCEDMAILIADILTSLESTKDWEINFVLMDTDSPQNPKKANHVILHIDTGDYRTYIEPTIAASSLDDVATAAEKAMTSWNGQGVRGWFEEVTRKG